jgi:hypothetical protein
VPVPEAPDLDIENMPIGFSRAANFNRKEFFSRLRRVTSMRQVTAKDLLNNVIGANTGDRSDDALKMQLEYMKDKADK